MKYTWGCEKHKVEPIERVWNDLYTVAMATCTMGVYEEPQKMMECSNMAMDMNKKKGTCDIPHAMTCLTAWHTKLMKTDEDICRFEFVFCVFRRLTLGDLYLEIQVP